MAGNHFIKIVSQLFILLQCIFNFLTGQSAVALTIPAVDSVNSFEDIFKQCGWYFVRVDIAIGIIIGFFQCGKAELLPVILRDQLYTAFNFNVGKINRACCSFSCSYAFYIVENSARRIFNLSTGAFFKHIVTCGIQKFMRVNKPAMAITAIEFAAFRHFQIFFTGGESGLIVQKLI